MTRRTFGLTNRLTGGAVLLLAFGCVPAGESELTGTLGVEVPEVEETSSLALILQDAGDEFGVPVDVLKSLAYLETRFVPAIGEVEFDGQPEPHGLFGLRGEELARAAQLVGHDVGLVKADDVANARATAALLSRYADEAGIDVALRDDPLAWGPAIARFGDLEEDLRADFVEDVLLPVRAGVAIPLEDGTTILIQRHDPAGALNVARTASGLGAAGVIWSPSPNYNSRSGSRVEMVIIHTCEGAYSGCVSWLRQSRASASAHYVVNEDGSRVAQLVDETNRAWHVAASYRSSLNSGQLASRNGQSVNNFSVGIEHGGRASQSSFPAGQITRSVELVRDITGRHNIPRDRYHIVGHGQLQPESRTDPGPNWPWTSYLQRIAQGGGGGTTPPPGGGGTTPPPGGGTPGATIITVDNTTAGRFRASAAWERSTWAAGKIGSDYRFRSPEFTSDLAEYKINVETAARYEVFARVPGNGYNTDVPYIVNHRGGQTVVRRDISRRGDSWVSLGTFDFAAMDDWIVQISCWTGGRGFLIADAIRLERR